MVEVAGIVLGVLPLLISAMEHYEDCWRPFVRYRKFHSKFDAFQQRLKTQKVVFHNESRILLETILERDIANTMLEDSSHINWSRQDIEEQLGIQLDSSRDACIGIITQISEQLKIVEDDSKGLDSIIKHENLGVAGGKKWHRIVKKLKFSFSESQLDKALANLKALNDDFIQLSSQTSRLEVLRTRKEYRACKDSGRSIEKFQIIQEASRHAYGALSNSCTKHTEHLTHFCLEATAIENATAPQVRFQLAFQHLTFLGGTHSGDPVWFLIESIIGGSASDNKSPAQLGTASMSLVQTLKRQIDEKAIPCSKKAKKSVKFQSTGLPLVLDPHICEAEPVKELRNLCMRKNFCDQLRKCFLQPPLPNMPLGMLDEINRHKHLVYFPPSESKRGNRKATSLDQIMSGLSRNGLPQYERLHLARSLATAVLQYHATPWLREAWRSEDIYFFGLDEQSSLQQCLSLPAPHLNVCVKGPDSSLSRTSTFPTGGLVRNPLIFGLGVVLLEIGHAKTLRALQQPQNIRSNGDQVSEYLAVTRLASSIGRELGSTYGQIVQKCLYCDFGCGDDLSSPKLQAVYYQDVVKELEKLENGFRELQLGP